MASSNRLRGGKPALDRALRRMFKALQDRPLPGRLRSLLDQLDEGAREPPLKTRRG